MFNIHFSFLLRGAVPQLEDKGKSIDSGEDDVEVPILCIKPLFGTVFNFVLLLKITPHGHLWKFDYETTHIISYCSFKQINISLFVQYIEIDQALCHHSGISKFTIT